MNTTNSFFFNPPYNMQFIGFSLLLISFFLIFFNDFLGFEGALIFTFLFSIFLKLNKFFGIKTKLSKEEKWLVYSISFYIFMMLFSSIIHSDTYDSFSRFWVKYNKVLYFIGFVYLIKFIQFDLRKFELLIITLAYLIILMLFLEVINHGYISHLGGVYSNKGTGAWFFSSVMITTAVFFLFYLKNSQKIKALHYLALTSALSLILLFTSTKSIWLSVFLSALIMLPISVKTLDIKTKKNSRFFWALLFTTLALVYFGQNPLVKAYQQAESSITGIYKNDYYSTLGLRLLQYKTAINGIKEKPIWGLGEVNYKKEMKLVYEARIGDANEESYKQNAKFKHIHNQLLMDFWMKGIFGLLSLILLFLVPGFYFYKGLKSSPENVVAIIGITYLISSFIFFLFGAVLTYSHGVVFFFLWLVLLTGVYSGIKENAKDYSNTAL